eukprot:697558-Amphidinium_carterae.1
MWSSHQVADEASWGRSLQSVAVKLARCHDNLCACPVKNSLKARAPHIEHESLLEVVILSAAPLA